MEETWEWQDAPKDPSKDGNIDEVRLQCWIPEPRHNQNDRELNFSGQQYLSATTRR